MCLLCAALGRIECLYAVFACLLHSTSAGYSPTMTCVHCHISWWWLLLLLLFSAIATSSRSALVQLKHGGKTRVCYSRLRRTHIDSQHNTTSQLPLRSSHGLVPENNHLVLSGRWKKRSARYLHSRTHRITSMSLRAPSSPSFLSLTVAPHASN